MQKLLRRGKHLRLCLPWRPIFDMIRQHASSKLRVAAYSSRSQVQAHLSALARCAAQCRRHFAAASSPWASAAIVDITFSAASVAAALAATAAASCCATTIYATSPATSVVPTALAAAFAQRLRAIGAAPTLVALTDGLGARAVTGASDARDG